MRLKSEPLTMRRTRSTAAAACPASTISRRLPRPSTRRQRMAVELLVREADVALVGLAGPEAGRRGLAADRGRHAEVGREVADLRLVEVADGIDRAGHVAVDRAVADEELGLVARPQDEPALARGIVVEDGHPLPGHLVAALDAALRRVGGEVEVDLGGDIDRLVPDAQPRGEGPGVADVFGEGLAVRHDQPQDVPRAEGPGGQGR